MAGTPLDPSLYRRGLRVLLSRLTDIPAGKAYRVLLSRLTDFLVGDAGLGVLAQRAVT